METRANHVWVGAITLVLIAVLAGVIIWVARLSEGRQDTYDIFFKQSVDGLSKGSTVTYAGVPAGQITDIELWQKDPSFVRVRIDIDRKIKILQGTTATIQSSFTGVSNIQLNGGVTGAPAIIEPGPEGEPVIPTKRGGFGELLTNAPLLLERLASLAERLNLLLSDENQKTFGRILKNTETLTDNLADASPQVKTTLSELQVTLKQAATTLAGFEKVANAADSFLNRDGESLALQLRTTLSSAQRAADQLQATLNDAQPAARQLSESTLPAAEQAIRDLRATTRALRDVTERIDNQGAAAVIGGPKLPEFKP